MSVWKGMQTSQFGFCGDGSGVSQVYLYPDEYLTYAIEYPGIREDIPRLQLKPDGTEEYRITDHLASVRVSLDGSGTLTNTYDYKPFGGILSSGGEARQGFNSREKDVEHDLFNNGVRKLDDGLGKFTSIDPLWEKFRSWSPYQYGYNNPMSVTDPSGMQGERLIWNPIYINKPLDGLGGGAGGGLAIVIGIKALAEAVENVVGGNSGAQTNPWDGPVDKPVIVVDPPGNAIPVGEGEYLTGSPDGRFIQVRDKDGNETGRRIDGPHKGPSHKDPRSREPHGHIPGRENPDGTPWLPIKFLERLIVQPNQESRADNSSSSKSSFQSAPLAPPKGGSDSYIGPASIVPPIE